MYYECYICGGNCDAGDLVNGICDECRDTEKQKNQKSAHLEQKWDRLVIKTKGQLRFSMKN